jgi:hypothetical protein
LHRVLETRIFSRQADAAPTPEDRAELIATLAGNPMAGDLMAGLGGVRKLRWAPRERGKSGAFRVVYHLLNDDLPILALLLYAKNEQAEVSPDQRKVILSLIEGIKRASRATRT